MRTIKFRAWNTRSLWKNKDGTDCAPIMEYDGFIIYPNTGECEFPQGGWDLSGDTEKGMYLMQFTGLLDKNGKEIYEGDIVKVADKSICVVDFHAGQFVFSITNPDPRTGGKRWCNESVYFNLQSEVIGNIYENPDLLSNNK